MRAAWLAVMLLTAGCLNITDPTELKDGLGGIRGRLIETQDEASQGEPRVPVADANVLVFRLGQLVTSTRTDADGAFIIPNLNPAGYEVRAGRDGYDVPTRGVRVLAGIYSEVEFEAHPIR